MAFGKNWGQKDILKDKPGGENYDHITYYLLLVAEECGFHTKSHEERLIDKTNEHNFRWLFAHA